MKLYKNVDICDLEAILEQGILPISVTGNDNWSDSKRAKNSIDVVYLFDAKRGTSCKNYGAALLEVEVEGAVRNEMCANDVNIGKYDEYIIDRVKPSEIVAAYVPEFFAGEIPDSIRERVTLCEMSAKYIDDCTMGEYAPLDAEHLAIFAATAKANTWAYGYFRGLNPNNTVFDLKDVEYRI